MILIAIALIAQAVTAAQVQAADKQKMEISVTSLVFCSNDQAKRLDDGKAEVEAIVSAVRLACASQRDDVREALVSVAHSSSELVGMPLDETAIQRVTEKNMAQTDDSLRAIVTKHILENRKANAKY